MKMNENISYIFREIGLENDQLNGALIPREILLDTGIYDKVRKKIPELKKVLSSSYLNSLHDNAKDRQKWPMLNLIRQILHFYSYQMKPIRKSDGYTPEGVKKYKRYFLVTKLKNSQKQEPEQEHETEHEHEPITTEELLET